MSEFLFRSITHLEMDEERYLEYILSNYGDLGLDYSFPVALSFMHSPLLAGGGLIVFGEDPYIPVGVAGYVIGTGSNEFQDRDVCQIEIIHLLEPYRGTRLFLQLFMQLLENLRDHEPQVQRVQFWVKPTEPRMLRLLSRMLRLPGGQCDQRSHLALYSVPYESLWNYGQALTRSWHR
ncbi:hypothetical protein [Paenibacillus sp. SYP-B4298]|uniref:hypothetical protein n=1 Tax=Paenibacillus sp. SYP-B4298 TaxID=2996034 RepID=UPI0022DCF83B|nr:hypothetical protein [Paenibacillus sp. SYP-B4298]